MVPGELFFFFHFSLKKREDMYLILLEIVYLLMPTWYRTIISGKQDDGYGCVQEDSKSGAAGWSGGEDGLGKA